MEELLLISLKAAVAAGEAVLDIYNLKEVSVKEKEDKSPLTEADLRSQKTILSFLSKTNFPILSEEGKDIPYFERKNWKSFWLVDHLDGTKEFIKRNGEFTVNIALIENGIPVLGVVYAPAIGELYFALKGLGAYKIESLKISEIEKEDIDLKTILNNSQTLCPSSLNQSEVTVVASRSHMSKETEEFIKRLEEKHSTVKTVSKGSSLKLCLVAEGKVDIYPRFAPTMEWDTAAGQAVVEISGGKVVNAKTKAPLRYNKENLLNPYFVATRKGYEL